MKEIIDIEDCPFCGAKVEEHPNINTRKEFFIIYHKENCFYLLNNSSNYTLLAKTSQNRWNKRI